MTRFSRSGREVSPLKYFSISREAIGAAQVAPKPAFSTYAATAIFGSSIGAKQINTELSAPRGFWAVPVLPQMSSPFTSATQAVQPVPGPLLTALHIPLTAFWKWVVSTIVYCLSLYLGSISTPSDSLTMCGILYQPLLAIIAARLAIWRGVTPTSPCPMEMEMIVVNFQPPFP